jgi:hypothetical protein
MINIEVDQEKFEEIFKQKVDEYLKTVETESFFMTFQELSNYLNMSNVSIREFLLWREDFPKIRLGSKWLFPRKEVTVFMEKYIEEVREAGGDIHAMKRYKIGRKT